MVKQVPRRRILLYSDAEGNGRIGMVVSRSDGALFSGRARVPPSIRRLLLPRRTNIVAFELIAAVVAIVGFCPHLLHDAIITHYIDNKAALSCVIKGYIRIFQTR